MLSCLIYSSIEISQAQTGNNNTTEVWVEQGNDVLLKDASKNVSVGDIQAQEKLHINGNVRIDGLQGAGNRFVLIDPDGKLIEGPPEGEHGGGPPKDIKNPGAQICKPAVGAWRDNGGGLLQLCPTIFQKVHIGTLTSVSNADFEVVGAAKFHNYVEVLGSFTMPTGNINLMNGRMGVGKSYDPQYRMDINGKLRSTEMFSNSVTFGTANITSVLNTSSIFSPTGKVVFNGNNPTNPAHPILLGVGTTDPKKAVHIYTAHSDDGQSGSHNGLRIEDTYTNVSTTTTYDLESFGKEQKFSISRLRSDGTKQPFLTFLNEGRTEISGDLYVAGKIGSALGTGLELTENFSTSGYLKSGNSIYIDGTQTGTDESNIIYSSNYLLSIIGGTPTEPEEKNIKFGVATYTPREALDVNGNVVVRFNLAIGEDLGGNSSIQSRFLLKSKQNTGGFHSVLSIIDGWDQNIFSIKEGYEVGLSENIKYVTFGEENMANSILKYSVYGDMRIFGKADFDGDFEIKSAAIFNGTVQIHNKLDVLGTIQACDIIVEEQGCDYVFESDYKLMPISDLKQFLEKEKHLPGVKSAKEMQTNGVALGDQQNKDREKLEELYLYVIKLHEEIEKVKEDNVILHERLAGNSSKEENINDTK